MTKRETYIDKDGVELLCYPTAEQIALAPENASRDRQVMALRSLRASAAANASPQYAEETSKLADALAAHMLVSGAALPPAEITADTEITGAQFRDFYENHWPKGFWVEDDYIGIDDDEGNFLLSDTETYKLGGFGWAERSKEDTPAGEGTSFSILELYERYVQQKSDCVTLTIRVPKDKLQAVAEAIISSGGEPI